MPEKTDTIKIDYYLGLVLKQRWLLIIPFCIAMAVGMYLAVKLPKIYEASTLILIMPQRVPSELCTVHRDHRHRFAHQHHLRADFEPLQPGEDYRKIRSFFGPEIQRHVSGRYGGRRCAKRIEVKVNRADRQRTPMPFQYLLKGPHPKSSWRLPISLPASFIDENLKVREAQAVGTSDFLADELITKRQRLEEVEQKLREYRRQYMGELPEQLDANLRILERIQTQLSEREKTLRDEKSRLVVIENQIEGNRKILAESRETGTVSEQGRCVEPGTAQGPARHPEKQLHRSPSRCHQAEGPNCRT